MKYFFLPLLLVGCQLSGSRETTSDIKWYVDAIHLPMPEQGNVALLLVPTEGCEGCIKSIRRFIESDLDRHDNLYAVVVPRTSKEAHIKVGQSENPRFTLDLSQVARKGGLLSHLPVLFLIEDMQIVERKELSGLSVDDELQQLKSRLEIGLDLKR